jgi:glyoxylase-like metal-dependent hydrolase (beta-lactamase superfamily II)/rhodanese-related sulfurtransferase
MTKQRAQVTEWTVREQKEHLDRRAKFLILDVRNRDEFSAWKIEGRQTPPMLNIPYFEMLEQGGKDDFIESIIAYTSRELVGQLPKDQPIVAVCAKGDTSAYVADGLRQLGYHAVNLQGGMRAWGNFTEINPVTESRELGVYQISRPARGCLSYIIVSDGQAVVIDPLRHIETYLNVARAKGFRIEQVIDTHGHADHISGGPALAGQLGRPYYLHPYDAIHPIDLLPARIPFAYLRDGQPLSVGKARIHILHIPGHTLGNVACLLNESYVFTGDSIFINSIARPDLGGRGETWAGLHYHSLRRLLDLPDTTVVLPGHFSSPREANVDGCFMASLGELKEKNDGLRMTQTSEEAFVQYILGSLPEFPPQYVEIKRVNAGLLAVDEEKASELELGKNVCALAHAYKADPT